MAIKRMVLAVLAVVLVCGMAVGCDKNASLNGTFISMDEYGETEFELKLNNGNYEVFYFRLGTKLAKGTYSTADGKMTAKITDIDGDFLASEMGGGDLDTKLYPIDGSEVKTIAGEYYEELLGFLQITAPYSFAENTLTCDILGELFGTGEVTYFKTTADSSLDGTWAHENGGIEIKLNNRNFEMSGWNNKERKMIKTAKGTYRFVDGKMITKTTHLFGDNITNMGGKNIDAKWYPLNEVKTLLNLTEEEYEERFSQERTYYAIENKLILLVPQGDGGVFLWKFTRQGNANNNASKKIPKVSARKEGMDWSFQDMLEYLDSVFPNFSYNETEFGIVFGPAVYFQWSDDSRVYVQARNSETEAKNAADSAILKFDDYAFSWGRFYFTSRYEDDIDFLKDYFPR